MGEVYRARDTRLDRSVAIKVLHAGVAAKPELRQRFEREARAVSSLNHAHICTLHDIGQQDGMDYLVMEYLEGITLADRLAKARLPMDQALRYGTDIADALAAAHARGIVHRDLKPGNIMVTKAGIKILDFGVAKFNCLDGQTDSWAATLTQSRAILGTPAYMAPEQLEGKECDARTDIFALGLVLYEMATGTRAFVGQSRAELISEIMHGERPLDHLSAPQFAHVVQSCMAKDAASRWQSASDVKLELEWAQESHPSPLQRDRFRWIAAMAALAFVVGVGSWLFWRTPRPENRPLVRLNVDLGSGVVSGFVWDRLGDAQAVLSPDGSRIAFVTRGSDGQQRLATRSLEQSNTAVLPETENAVDPFFSPNGQWLGFFAEGKLKKISIQGGAPVVLSDGFSNDRGASWGEDESIVVSPNPVSDLLRLPAGGGAPQQVKGTSLCQWPQILPGGHAILVTRDTGSGTANVEVLSLSTGLTTVVAPGGYRGRYLPNGHLLFVHEGVLFGVAFDLERLQPRGVPVPLLDDVADNGAIIDPWGNPTFAAGQFDFGRNGAFFYFSGKLKLMNDPSSLAWVDRFGPTKTIPLTLNLYSHPRISPDGKRLAVAANSNIWVLDFSRDTPVRITFKTNFNQQPEWAPDGQHLVYSGRTGSSFGLWWTRADGAGEPQRLLESQSFVAPSSISADGKRIAFHEWTTKTGWDIWTLPIDIRDAEHPKPGQPQAFLATPQDEVSASFSPDGRWIAYMSPEPGSRGISVRPVSGPGGPWQIAGGNCIFPLWSRDGRTLYYLVPGKGIIEASYRVQEGAFLAQETGTWSQAPTLQMGKATNFAVHPDGKRAVVVLAPETPASQNSNVHVTFLLNFLDEVRRRVAAGNK
jgi:serine/threonine-protein kinase